MSLNQKSDLLHSIANSAVAEVEEEEHPEEHKKPLTEEQIVAEREQTASQVEAQTFELEDKEFSSDDLKAFTQMTSQNGDKTFK